MTVFGSLATLARWRNTTVTTMSDIPFELRTEMTGKTSPANAAEGDALVFAYLAT